MCLGSERKEKYEQGIRIRIRSETKNHHQLNILKTTGKISIKIYPNLEAVINDAKSVSLFGESDVFVLLDEVFREPVESVGSLESAYRGEDPARAAVPLVLHRRQRSARHAAEGGEEGDIGRHR